MHSYTCAPSACTVATRVWPGAAMAAGISARTAASGRVRQASVRVATMGRMGSLPGEAGFRCRPGMTRPAPAPRPSFGLRRHTGPDSRITRHHNAAISRHRGNAAWPEPLSAIERARPPAPSHRDPRLPLPRVPLRFGEHCRRQPAAPGSTPRLPGGPERCPLQSRKTPRVPRVMIARAAEHEVCVGTLRYGTQTQLEGLPQALPGLLSRRPLPGDDHIGARLVPHAQSRHRQPAAPTDGR